MEVVLNYSNKRFRVEIIEKNRRKRTNNSQRINEIILELPSDPFVIKQSSNDIKIIYNNGIKLTLKDYKKYQHSQLYGDIFANIDKKTPVVKNVRRLNKTKLAALALTTVVFVSAAIPKIITKPEGTSETEIICEAPIETPEIIEPKLKIEENEISIDESNYDLMTRLEQSKGLLNGKISNNPVFPISNRLSEFSINKLVNFINSEDGKYCFEVCNDFGIDPYSYVCLLMCESSLNHNDTIPGGKSYNGFAVGISQLETPNGKEVTAFNYTTNQEETMYETMDNAINIRSNMKLGIMNYQNVLNRYHGNERLAFQSYNYGYGLVDLIVNIYADEIGVSFDEVVNNLEDVGWLKYVKEVHEDPIGFANKYEKYEKYGATINYLKNWKYSTYGNGDYISDLFSYYIGIYSKNVVNGEVVETNLLDNSVVRTFYTNQNDYKIS